MNENVAANNAGRLGFDIKGYYENTVTYDFLDVVYYNNSSYVAKKITVGNEPQENNEYWQILAKGSTSNIVTGVKGDNEDEYRSGEVNITAGNVGALPITGGKMRGSLDMAYQSIKLGDDIVIGGFTSGHQLVVYDNLNNGGFIFDGNGLSPLRQGDSAEKLGTVIFPWKEVWAKEVKIGSNNALSTANNLNTIEEISANTGSNNTAGALAAKAMMADYNNKINQINSNLIIYRTWQFLTESDAILISPNTVRYFGIEKPVVDGYTCIGVSLQEKHGAANGYLLVTYTESLMTVHNPRDTDAYFWGAIFKFVYIKR